MRESGQHSNALITSMIELSIGANGATMGWMGHEDGWVHFIVHQLTFS